MKDQDILAQKNISTQLDLLKKIRSCESMSAYCIKNLVSKVDTIIRENIKCVDNNASPKDRKWTMTISQDDWVIVSSLLTISKERPVDELHGKEMDKIRIYQETLNSLQ